MFLEIQHDEIRKTMKNLLFILALLPGLAFAASSDSLYWTNAAADNDMNNPANYTEGDAGGAAAEIAATDTLFFATGSAAATASGNISVANVVTTAGYSGAWSINGYTLTTSTNGPAFDHTGTLHLGNGITCNGASGTFHVGAGVGTVTATSCVLTMNGTTEMVIDIDKSMNLLQLVLGANAVVVNSGAETCTFIGSPNEPLIFAAGATFTNNRSVAFGGALGLAKPFMSFAGAYTFNGSQPVSFWSRGSMTLPAFTYTGTGIINLVVNGTNSLVVTGNQSYGGGCALSTYVTDGTTATIDFNDFNLTATTLSVTKLTVAQNLTYNFGNGTFNIAVFAGGALAGTSNVNLESAVINCSGNWTFGSNHTVVPGTSIVTLNGTGAQTITSAGKSFYDLTINNSGTAFVVLADSLTANDLTLTDGPFNAASYGISAVDLIHASTDSVRFQNLWLTGDYTRGATATKSDTSGQHIRFSASASHTMAAANKTYALVTTSGPLTITGGATIAALSYDIDGIPVTIAAGTTLTAGTVSIGGTTLAPDTLQGAGAGATLDLTGNQTVTWALPVTVIGVALAAGDTVTLTQGIDGGGNTGAWIFPSSSTTRRKRGMTLDIGVIIR
jgi:fibronectin-binding autotransporter adhesin